MLSKEKCSIAMREAQTEPTEKGSNIKDAKSLKSKQMVIDSKPIV